MRERRADLADLTVLADLDDLIVLAHLADGVDVVAVLDAGGELDARCDERSPYLRALASASSIWTASIWLSMATRLDASHERQQSTWTRRVTASYTGRRWGGCSPVT